LSAGRSDWAVGERVSVYRARGGRAALFITPDAGEVTPTDARDYDVGFYQRLLRETFAARLARAFTPEDFSAVFADPAQPSLFEIVLSDVRPILTRQSAG
jgi:DNA polymerase, archaea type